MFPHPCLYADDFNCRHADWVYDDNSPDGECLAGWASINCLGHIYNAKDAASFYSGRWNTGTNPDLAFASVGPNSCLPDRRVLKSSPSHNIDLGGGGGFTRTIPRDGGADQFRGIPIVGRLPTDGTRGPEKKGCGRKWPDVEGLVQGSRARDVRDPVVQNHSCCKKESRLYQPCGDKS